MDLDAAATGRNVLVRGVSALKSAELVLHVRAPPRVVAHAREV